MRKCSPDSGTRHQGLAKHPIGVLLALALPKRGEWVQPGTWELQGGHAQHPYNQRAILSMQEELQRRRHLRESDLRNL